MKKGYLLIVAIAILGSLSGISLAQCNAFTKKKCLPQLAPFIHNGQLNSVSLYAGESVELMMTFYSGQKYRLQVCAQEVLGDMNFKVMDAKRTVIFDNRDHRNAGSWDFNVASTQQLIIEVSAPPSKTTHDIQESGCVSLLVGFKEGI